MALLLFLWTAAIVALCGAAVGVPLAVHRVLARRHRSSWDVVVEAPPAGAYRTARLEVIALGKVPAVVVAASLVSLWTASAMLAVLLFSVMSDGRPAVEEFAALAALVATVLGVALVRRSNLAIAIASTVLSCDLLAAALALAIWRGDDLASPLLLVAHAALLGAAVRAHARGSLVACASRSTARTESYRAR